MSRIGLLPVAALAAAAPALTTMPPVLMPSMFMPPMAMPLVATALALMWLRGLLGVSMIAAATVSPLALGAVWCCLGAAHRDGVHAICPSYRR